MIVLPQTKNLYLYHSVGCQKSLNIPKGKSEVVNRQQTRTDNTMTERTKELLCMTSSSNMTIE